MKIFFINNDGGGFADHMEIEGGTTVEQLFERELGRHAKPEDYLIRVNRQPSSRDQALQEGDRVSVTPSKIQVAA
jgi:sulfur carrier protein ThiS